MKYVAVMLALASGCTQSHIVRPLGKGNGVVHASLGGPFVHVFGIDIPAPIVSLGGGYGVRKDLDVFAHLDVTALQPGHPVLQIGMDTPQVTADLLADFNPEAIPMRLSMGVIQSNVIEIGGSSIEVLAYRQATTENGESASFPVRY